MVGGGGGDEQTVGAVPVLAVRVQQRQRLENLHGMVTSRHTRHRKRDARAVQNVWGFSASCNHPHLTDTAVR